MAAVRQPLLYDVVPWQRVRLGGPVMAVILLAAAAVIGPGELGAMVGVGAFVVVGGVIGVWLRSRTSYVSADAEALTMRSGRRRLSVPRGAIVESQVGPLERLRQRAASRAAGAKVNAPGRPLQTRWAAVQALSLTLSREGFDAADPRKHLGKRLADRYFHGRDLVIPVGDPAALRTALLSGDRASGTATKSKRRAAR